MSKRKNSTGIPGLSFSWKRALGITRAKQHIARETGIPTTKQGRQRKLGRIMASGCLLPIVLAFLLAAVTAHLL